MFISGFDKGIEAVDSDFLMTGSRIQRCDIGMDLTNSTAIIHRSQLTDNVIDAVVNRSKAYMIDTIALRVLELLPKGDYRINPYALQNLALNIINTKDVREKRRRLRYLLKTLKKYSYIWTIYSIIKEIIRLAGVPI